MRDAKSLHLPGHGLSVAPRNRRVQSSQRRTLATVVDCDGHYQAARLPADMVFRRSSRQRVATVAGRESRASIRPTTKDTSATKAGSGGDGWPRGWSGAATSANSAAGSISQPTAAPGSGASASLPGGGSTVDSNPSTAVAAKTVEFEPSSPRCFAQPQNDSSSTPHPTRPSLLRPGETVESQQGNGRPFGSIKAISSTPHGR